MITVATACMNCAYDKQKNLEKYFSFIDQAAEKDAKLLVFPEQSLQAYLENLVVNKLSDFHYQFENAEVIPEGDSVQKIIAKAKEKNMYIIFGMTERDGENYYKLYNTMVLVGPEGYIGKYRKVHLPMDELHIYNHGTDFPVFDTEIGKIGMLICYDKAFPEAARELALGGAELLVMSTAWGCNDVKNGPDYKEDSMYFKYDLYDRARALENQCFFISSNQQGLAGETNYIGYSNIVNPCGHVVASTGSAEGIAYADIDVKKDIHIGRICWFVYAEGQKRGSI